MNPINEGYGLWHVTRHPGFNFQLVMAGHLHSFDGCHYNVGGYFCWHVIRSGHGVARSGRRRVELGPGDMFTLVADRKLEYFDDPADPWDFYYLHLEGPAVPMLTEQAGFDLHRPWRRPTQPETVLRYFQRLFRMAQTPAEWDAVHIHVEFLKLLDFLSSSPKRIVRTPAELVDHAVRLATDPGYIDVNVAELARALQVDRGTLHRAFTSALHQSPGDFLRARKLNRARELLRSRPDLTAAEIAAACGFDNDKYFIRAFKHAFHLPPARWREAAAEEKKGGEGESEGAENPF